MSTCFHNISTQEKNPIVIGFIKKEGKRKNNSNDANTISFISKNSEEAKMEGHWQTVIVSLWNMSYAVWKNKSIMMSMLFSW